MWVIFDKIEYNENIESKKSGKTYAAWEATGTKKGFQGSPDEPWSKIFFDNQTTTIIESGGIPNHNQSIVQYFLKAVQPGDTLNIKMERDGQFWRIISIENLNNMKPDYVPLAQQVSSTTSVHAQAALNGASNQAPPTGMPWD